MAWSTITWRALRQALLTISCRRTQVLAERSGHDIHGHDPGTIAGVIRSLTTPGPVHASQAQVVRAFDGDVIRRHGGGGPIGGRRRIHSSQVGAGSRRGNVGSCFNSAGSPNPKNCTMSKKHEKGTVGIITS